MTKAALAGEYCAVMGDVKKQLDDFSISHPEAAFYLTPFGFRIRCLFKMDCAEAEYIAKLRSGVKGHFSYGPIAWHMREALLNWYPVLGSRIAATPPDVEDSLRR